MGGAAASAIGSCKQTAYGASGAADDSRGSCKRAVYGVGGGAPLAAD